MLESARTNKDVISISITSISEYIHVQDSTFEQYRLQYLGQKSLELKLDKFCKPLGTFFNSEYGWTIKYCPDNIEKSVKASRHRFEQNYSNISP
jgi:hypothetical protein